MKIKMKKIYYFVGIVVSSLALASCDGYLDKTPDGYCHLPLSLFEFARQAKDKRVQKG